ncbi:MAG: DUF3299 domain-containing protein [Gammaproteobacteria bacterium]|nr:DUF3299 domain-containing protein [Gammaproteobacteria bacterium]MCP5299477.1 DUF3299 domain-containing protein [Chromatiaceae bacterium]
MQPPFARLALLLILVLTAASHAAPSTATDDGVRELEWDALIPADWDPEKMMEQYDASGLSDADPKAKAMLKKIRQVWDAAPVVKALDGQRVKLPGFVVPLEMDAKSIKEFLLVPYYGACIHVPPPPTNQTVHVTMPAGEPYRGELFDTVWVTGVIRVERFNNDMGDAGYSIDAGRVEPYQ